LRGRLEINKRWRREETLGYENWKWKENIIERT